MISIWIIIAFVLYEEGLLTTDINKINVVVGTNPVKMRVIFVLLSSFRVILFIPQTIFIFIGSVLFGAYEGFILSFIALIISQTIMYIVGRYFQIVYLNIVVGFILVVPVEDPEYGEMLELEIGVFDKYTNEKFASQALDIIIAELSNNNINAIISPNNPNKDRVRSLLKKKGFVLCNADDELWLYTSNRK